MAILSYYNNIAMIGQEYYLSELHEKLDCFVEIYCEQDNKKVYHKDKEVYKYNNNDGFIAKELTVDESIKFVCNIKNLYIQPDYRAERDEIKDIKKIFDIAEKINNQLNINDINKNIKVITDNVKDNVQNTTDIINLFTDIDKNRTNLEEQVNKVNNRLDKLESNMEQILKLLQKS